MNFFLASLIIFINFNVGQSGITPRLDKEVIEGTFGFIPEVTKGEPTQEYNGYSVDKIRNKIAEYAPVIVTTDTSNFTDTELRVLDLIIDAAKYMDPIFNRQVFRWYDETRENLASDSSELAVAQLELYNMMRGPWDRQNHHESFAVDIERPSGGGFYPADITQEKWEKYVQEHPEERDHLEDLVTIVVDDGSGDLKWQNYSTFFQPYLHPAHNHMLAAAILTENQSLKTFLKSRANAFITNDYFQSDKDWMDLDSKIEVTIGPYETYEDKFLGLKASYEAFVTITDPVESEKLTKFKSYLPDMEANLPIEDDMKTNRGAESPIRVVDLVFAAGDARKSVQTLAFNLPNDERVRKEKGAKKVMLKNQIANKFTQILTPIANTLMNEEQMEYLDGDAFFNNVLFHELSHSLGPAFVNNDEAQGPISKALGASYSSIEEAKADVMGVYNILFMIEKGEFPESLRKKSLFTYVSGLFRSIRFGVAESHGRGAAFQLNTYLGENSVIFNSETGKYEVDMEKIESSISNLVRKICTIQHNGDKEVVDSELATLGVLDEVTAANLKKLEEIPVDIRPCYPLAGEQC